MRNPCTRSRILITDVLINLLKRTEEDYLLIILNRLSLEYNAVLIPGKVKEEFINLKPGRESYKHRRLLLTLYEYMPERFMDCPINNSRPQLYQSMEHSKRTGCLIQSGEADAILQGNKCSEIEAPLEVYILTGDKCAIQFIRSNSNLKVKPLNYREWKKQFLEEGIILP